MERICEQSWEYLRNTEQQHQRLPLLEQNREEKGENLRQKSSSGGGVLAEIQRLRLTL